QKHIDHSSCDYQQWLMLKENFRQSGEYENEDICHLRFQREKTKKERNIIKKAGRFFRKLIPSFDTKTVPNGLRTQRIQRKTKQNERNLREIRPK
ncbi:MAG: hypothetical protein IJF80_06975, partial [Clostridia bacterium]|nr:hypothetical protein [Clostridia bacterium]